MVVFIVLLLVPILIQHIVIRRHSVNLEKKNNMALAFFFIMLTVLVMLRHESVGNDTNNYIHYFDKFSKISWINVGKESIEVGFSFFNKIVSLFTNTSRIYLSIMAILTSVMIYPTYKRLCVDSSLTIVLFVTMSTFVMMFSGIRQMFAVAIGFVAYEFTRKKRLIPFLIAVFVATSFHLSAFMLFFMYPIFCAKITKKWLIAVVPILLVILVFNNEIFTFLILFIEQYTRFESDVLSTGAYTMIILLSVFTVFSFVIPDERVMDNETIGLRNFLLFSLIIQMFAPLHNLAMRMNYYYIIFIPLLLPKIIEFRSERWKQVAVVGRHIMVVFFLLYFFVSASNSNSLHVFPYHFFWENIG